MKNSRRDFIKLASTGVLSPYLVDDFAKLLAIESAPRSGTRRQGPADNYQRWLWIELIGFDHVAADFGVGNFIKNTGFVPEAVSFLFASADFVHSHSGVDNEWVFPDEFCSYAARPASPERKRQPWTNRQLKGLIDQLHKHGVSVYCSFFDFFVDTEGPGRWAYQYREIRETSVNGTVYPYIHPLKRFNDGTFYEDLFVKQLKTVLADYGFDGLHGADGYTSGRRPLNDVDYTDDMMDQFVAHSDVKLPAEFGSKIGDDKGLLAERGKWVWEHRREEWIRFHVDRWSIFWQKVIDGVHGQQKKVVFNSAWTRDPFEAIYRYGIDYRRITDLGVDGFIVEAVASAVAMEPELSDEYTKFYYNALAMILLIKAHCPEAVLRPFTQIHDTTEQYDALRHIPTFVEREICQVANLYVVDREGKMGRCSSGPMCCLSDSVAAHEWTWLRKRWDLGFMDQPEAVVGATLVWSTSALDNQLSEYIAHKSWTVHKWLYELLLAGAPVAAAVPIEDLDRVDGPILVLNPGLLPGDELEKVTAYKKGAAFFIGSTVSSVSHASALTFSDPVNRTVSCSVLNTSVDQQVAVDDVNEVIQSATTYGSDPDSWTKSLAFVPVSLGFVNTCARVIRSEAKGPLVVSDHSDNIKITTLVLSNGRWRLLIGSDSFYYQTPAIQMPRTIAAIDVRSTFPGVPVRFSEDTFRVRIPGRGMVVLDLEMS
ncbi:hypothetical protein [Parapedobacter indicus]|uniref:Uncharacterized protein n=1 Tax=Parapedobacter indicus TaxID=1477437 RepID=A0A1I3TF24_9SPHI|nr:hypothetical protein [Parapedobacter indicus]PPK99522.1 hypothetical protein CLV26_11240 [Parapedobacter indicus]SFJ69220.1 hypothetical protein SAMN05444682_112141 [Parapedobacter indicus]